MSDLFVVLSKYLFVILMAFFAWESFRVLQTSSVQKADRIFLRQNFIVYATYILGIIIVYMNNSSDTTILLAGAQLIYLVVVLGIFPVIYPKFDRSLLNNMCMLLSIGFIILARLDYEDSIRQFAIVAAGSLLILGVPFIMSRFAALRRFTWAYYALGLVLLLSVLLFGHVENGAKLSIGVSGYFSIQPSEFVKIIYVFFLAGLLAKKPGFKKVALSAVLAGLYVIILVCSKDLGSALIFFMIYMFMLYVSSRNKIYLLICAGGGCAAAFVSSMIFTHVQERIAAFKDPWSVIDSAGYQVAQSLFAICSGRFTGTGLYRGEPESIPLVQQDFVFSAIAEEFGGIFAMLLILVCLGCFLAFIKIALRQTDSFRRLVAFGLSIGYAVQVILTIGGAIKMIPSTGVTLPLISAGGSSIISTLLMFSIAQGLSIGAGEAREIPDDNGGYEA